MNRRVVAVGLLGLIGIVVVAVITFAVTPPPVDPKIALADIAWTELTPPGSVILETRGKRPPSGESLVGHRLWVATTDSEAEVKAFYKALLDGRPGWLPDGSLTGIRWTDEIDTCTWHAEGLTFRLGVQDMGGPREIRAPDRGWPTVFSIQVWEGASEKVETAACLTEQ